MFNLKNVAKGSVIAALVVMTPVQATESKSRTHTEEKYVIYTLYDEAKSYIGLSEKQHPNTIQRLTKVNPKRTPWCAAFVNGILRNKGYDTTDSNQASSFRNYGVAVKIPREGDIVVFRNHVGLFAGFVKRNGRTYVAVLGGNQSNQVKISYFSRSSVISYRRPT
jgi:uncharacterized protein (TIGR02594 family)